MEGRETGAQSAGAGMGFKIESTEFEVVLADLAGLTPGQLVERVLERTQPKDVAAFVSTAAGLSVETLRLLTARTLVRQRCVKT